jgi:hypothetical protein
MKRMVLIALLSLFALPALAQTLTLPQALPAGTYTLTPQGGPPPPPPPPPPGTSWVYHAGVFSWPGDWSWAGHPNYKDTAGKPASGTFDIAYTLVSPWGGWQPYAPGKTFSLTPYKFLILTIKTTVGLQPIHLHFEAANDTPIGKVIDPVAGGFGPTAVVGTWQQYKVPLAAFGITGATILKFAVQDDSGGVNTFYLDDVGFSP